MTPDHDRAEGERRRDAGVALASSPAHRQGRIMRAELSILDAILHRGEATADDAADDPAERYGDGGLLRLCRAMLIVETGCVRSVRPSRHRGRTRLYRALDLDACRRRRADIAAWLAAHPDLRDQTPDTSYTQPTLY